MQTIPGKTSKASSDLRDELKQLGDQIRLQIHLAGMDAKSEWNKLEPKARRLEEELHTRHEQAAMATRARATELADALRAFVDKHLGARSSDTPAITAIKYGFTTKLGEVDLATAIERTKAALAEEGFGVLSEIDIEAALAKKLGVATHPYVILGACNPKLAHQALEGDPYIGLLLPCNVTVQSRDGVVEVSALSPKAMLSLADTDSASMLAGEAEARLRRALAAIAASFPS